MDDILVAKLLVSPPGKGPSWSPDDDTIVVSPSLSLPVISAVDCHPRPLGMEYCRIRGIRLVASSATADPFLRLSLDKMTCIFSMRYYRPPPAVSERPASVLASPTFLQVLEYILNANFPKESKDVMEKLINAEQTVELEVVHLPAEQAPLRVVDRLSIKLLKELDGTADEESRDQVKASYQAIAKLIPKLLAGRQLWDGCFLVVYWFNSPHLLSVSLPEDERQSPGSSLEELKQFFFTLAPSGCVEIMEERQAASLWRGRDDLLAALLKRVIGADELLRRLVGLLARCWEAGDDDERGSLFPEKKGVVLYGGHGTGKTFIVKTLRDLCGLPCHFIDSPALFRVNLGQTEAELHRIFIKACEGPCLLLVDDLEALAPGETVTRKSPWLARLSVSVAEFIDAAYRANPRLFVIATTARLENVDSALLRPGRLDCHLELQAPDREGRRDIFQHLLSLSFASPLPSVSDLKLDDKSLVLPLQLKTDKIGGNEDGKDEETVASWLADRTTGCVPADLENLCRIICMKTLSASLSQGEKMGEDNESLRMSAGVIVEALSDLERPSTLSDVGDLVQKERDGPVLSDVVGLDKVIEELSFSLLLPLKQPSAYKRLGIRPPRGILLHGPSGCGKSFLLRALGQELRGFATLLSLPCAQVLSKVLGEAEERLRRVFRAARESAPCILFLDQVESLAARRGSDSSTERSVERLLSTLLTEMDGIGRDRAGEDKKPVIVIAATTHISLLDSAILRPGRLEKHLFLPLPSESSRTALLRKQLQKVPLRSTSGEDLGAELAAATNGFSGSDLDNLVRESVLVALREDIHAKEVLCRHFLTALERLKQTSGRC